MKKHVIAAAVAAALVTPAIAQVTVSGTLDLTFHGTQKLSVAPSSGSPSASQGSAIKTTSSANGIATTGAFSTSVLNFAGSEDLGGGLKASFFVNQTINGNDGTLGARDRFIQLDGGFGSVKIGRYASAADGYGTFAVQGTTNTAGTSDSSGFDLVDGTLGRTHGLTGANISTTGFSINNGTVTTAPTTQTGRGFSQSSTSDAGSFGRQNGLIEYSTPSFNGFKATFTYANESVDRDGTDYANKGQAKQTGARLDYAAGPLAVAVAHHKRDVKDETAAGALLGYTNNGSVTYPVYVQDTLARDREAELSWLGIRYDLGVARIFASHATREDKMGVASSYGGAVAAVATTYDLKINTFGVQVPMGATTLFASMYKGTNKATTAATDDRDLDGHQFGATYALSKRTRAYLVVGENESTIKTAATSAANVKLEQTSIGLVHSF